MQSGIFWIYWNFYTNSLASTNSCDTAYSHHYFYTSSMHSGILAAKQATAVYRAVNAEGILGARGGLGSHSPRFGQTSYNPTLTRGTDYAHHVIVPGPWIFRPSYIPAL